jgi:hypothetical protein
VSSLVLLAVAVAVLIVTTGTQLMVNWWRSGTADKPGVDDGDS